MSRDIPFFEMFTELQLSGELRLRLAGAVVNGACIDQAGMSLALRLTTRAELGDAEREELTTRFLTIAAGGVLEGWLRGELTQTPEELTRQVDEIVQDYIRGVALRLKEPATTRR